MSLVIIYNKVTKLLRGHGIGKFFPVRFVNNFIVSRLKSTFTEVDGRKMSLDSNDDLYLSIRGIYEPMETEIVKKEIKIGDVVLDIGAHIGYYTLIFAKLVGEKGKVFAFEPNPDNFALLKKNVEINDCNNVELMQQAVSNETGKTRLYLSRQTVDHTIYNSHDDRQSIEIKATRLDDYFQDYDGKIDFIKVDVQGAEGRVIQGMLDILKKNYNIKILMEFLPVRLKISGIEPEECLKSLTELNFKLYEIVEREKKIRPTSIPELLEIYTPEKYNRTNLLCFREE